MTTLDQLIAAAQLRTATTAQLGLPEAETRAHLERLIGADVVALLDECEATPEGIARFVYQGLDYSLQLLPIGVVLTRHDPPMPEGVQRPRPFAAFSAYWPDGTTPGRDWFLVSLGQLAAAFSQ
ncbi:MAG: hypothetical protein IPP13_22400 [Kouleothrix sp.]|jgi:hypothetical protein|nr:hypothetical protein [Kouleothrix sp.]